MVVVSKDDVAGVVFVFLGSRSERREMQDILSLILSISLYRMNAVVFHNA